eukprot:Tbor_TRINITY_DN5449_c1_g5::TRINITY_DN5449_c1_g5_i1::g.24222::m.24222
MIYMPPKDDNTGNNNTCTNKVLRRRDIVHYAIVSHILERACTAATSLHNSRDRDNNSDILSSSSAYKPLDSAGGCGNDTDNLLQWWSIDFPAVAASLYTLSNGSILLTPNEVRGVYYAMMANVGSLLHNVASSNNNNSFARGDNDDAKAISLSHRAVLPSILLERPPYSPHPANHPRQTTPPMPDGFAALIDHYFSWQLSGNTDGYTPKVGGKRRREGINKEYIIANLLEGSSCPASLLLRQVRDHINPASSCNTTNDSNLVSPSRGRSKAVDMGNGVVLTGKRKMSNSLALSAYLDYVMANSNNNNIKKEEENEVKCEYNNNNTNNNGPLLPRLLWHMKPDMNFDKNNLANYCFKALAQAKVDKSITSTCVKKEKHNDDDDLTRKNAVSNRTTCDDEEEKNKRSMLLKRGLSLPCPKDTLERLLAQFEIIPGSEVFRYTVDPSTVMNHSGAHLGPYSAVIKRPCSLQLIRKSIFGPLEPLVAPTENPHRNARNKDTTPAPVLVAPTTFVPGVATARTTTLGELRALLWLISANCTVFNAPEGPFPEKGRVFIKRCVALVDDEAVILGGMI